MFRTCVLILCFSHRLWRNKLQNNSILLFIILLFFSCVQEIQCLTYNTTHALIVSFCILNKSLFLFWSHPYSYVFFFAIFWCFSSQTYHFPSTSTVYYWLLQNVNLFLLFIYIFSWTNLELSWTNLLLTPVDLYLQSPSNHSLENHVLWEYHILLTS